ncbi:MAG TPA: exodeoxyribonuclease VII small subunit [Candidatus Limnocylindria bacterium]|nr:exodeoxyribonuclease VII small subunit [Candidatus Limnocylindria bacterium]
MTDRPATDQQTAAPLEQDAERRRIAALPFDRALAELQTVVSRLEAGNLPLEESISLYEQGVLLHEHCARALSQAELRVQRLVESAGGQLRTLDLSLGEAEEAQGS